MDKIRDFLPSNQNVGYGVVDPVSAPARPKIKIKISPRIIAALIGAVVLAILIMVCTSMLTAMQQKPITLTEQLVAKMSNSVTTIDEYSDRLYASSMRSLTASLRDSLSGTATELTTFLTENYDYDLNKAGKTEVWLAETEQAEAIGADFENARLNGILDRTFAREAVLLIAEILSVESEIMARTSNENLTMILQNSTSSLENLANGFEEQQVATQPTLLAVNWRP